MKQLANEASRATAAKEAAKQKLKQRMSAMVSPSPTTGAPQVNIVPPKQVVNSTPAPAKPTQGKPAPGKSKVKARVKTKKARGFWEPNSND